MAIAAGVLAAQVEAQPVAEPALKAAFLYNFAKFTEWPPAAMPPRTPLVICTNDPNVASALADMTRSRSIAGHSVEVRTPALDDAARSGCHVLYAANLDAPRASRLLGELKSAATLTVGDLDQFVALGGIAQLFIEKDRVRFRIGVAAADRAGLRLASQLLSLAETN
jgi:hypothetical protein